MSWRALLASRLLIVSGKGGAGKSTVAAAIAAAAAAQGRRTLLTEIESRGELARTLAIPEPGHAEEPTPFGFGALSISPREAALEYLRTYYGMGAVSRPLARSGALDQVIGGAPGFRDLLVCGKLYELARAVRRPGPPAVRAAERRPAYDLIVVDGPPTGQLVAFLEAPGAYAQVFRVGRMRRHATSVAQLIQRRAAVVLVSLPEDMSVTETLEAIPAVQAVGVDVAAVVVNRARPPVFPAGTGAAGHRLRPEVVVRLADRAGLRLGEGLASSLLEGARSAERRRRSQDGLIGRLRAAGPPLLHLDDAIVGDAPALVRALAGAIAGGRGEGAPGHPALATPTAAPSPGVGRRREVERLDRRLAHARVIVVCGSGGVGKTTVSAAIAVELARRGRRTALLTVDPARRLATALSLPADAGDRTTLDVGRGRALEAMQLDTQRTFDELVARFAPSPAARDRILANGFYRRIADTLGGTHEYMAMERLHQLSEEEGHEAIVIDTPPTRSALSLLDAPRRLTDFLGGRFLRWMLLPPARAGRITVSAARIGATAFLRTAGRLVGAEVLADTAAFLSEFEVMFGGFRRRAAEVGELLRDGSTTFLVVATPTEPSLDEASVFLTRLAAEGMHTAAVVANRVRAAGGGRLPRRSERAAEVLAVGDASDRAVGALIALRLRERAAADHDAASVHRLRSLHTGTPVLAVPELDGEVHDVAGLRRLAPFLFGGPAPSETPRERHGTVERDGSQGDLGR